MIGSLKRPPAPEGLPALPVAGIVPHAGWVFSGGTALAVLEAIRDRRTPKTFVLLGACHHPVRRNAVFTEGGWETPLGTVTVDERVAREIVARAGNLADDDPQAHESEHSLEVQLPLIQHLFPEARIVPILVPPGAGAPALGQLAGQVIRDLDADAVVIGSTDLTHYGPMYGFTPKGVGPDAVRWVREENDRRMIDLMLALEADKIAPEAQDHWNACGAGAVAATLAAARSLGAEQGRLVNYTTSYDIMQAEMGRTDYEAVVGYAGLVF
jgi:hypothetical protein